MLPVGDCAVHWLNKLFPLNYSIPMEQSLGAMQMVGMLPNSLPAILAAFLWESINIISVEGEEIKRTVSLC